ncbi:MAG: haloacid dehalogenase [Candidatus Odinarchaeota archaeon]
MNLKNIFSELIQALDKLDLDREEILKISRTIIRDCSIAIKNIHRKEYEEYHEKLNSIKLVHKKFVSIVDKNPGAFSKYLKTPEQEYAEAVTFYSIVANEELPTPRELNIDPLNYAFGLADVVGELRRYALDNIRNSQIQDLNKILESMDEIYSYLFALDYPSGLTQDLRQKTDRVRSIIEKTRGDVSISLQMNELKTCIENNVKFNK